MQRKSVAIQLSRIHFHPYRRQRSAADNDLPHPWDLRELLLHDRRGFVVELGSVVFIGSEPEDHDGRISRIDLAISGVGGQDSQADRSVRH